MYILKNAYLNIVRKKGRNILIGLVIMTITIGASIALVIHKSGTKLIYNYKSNNPLEVSFSLNPMNFRNASDEDKSSFQSLTVEDLKTYGDSDYVKDYYYTEEVTLSSDDITPVTYETENTDETKENKENMDGRENKMAMGDFRMTGYSNPAYITEFISGTKKIKDGEMFHADETENVTVISEELATSNQIKVGDEITLYQTTDSDTKYTFKVIGIYEDNSDIETDSFMNMNAMNSRNQMYTPLAAMEQIVSKTEDTGKMISKSGLTAKFYLYNNEDLDAFTKEVQSKGLSTYYSVTTNEEEILASLKPIQNISQFSIVFLIIILIVGAIILGIINLINIRERKYEIGVLRAIGMRKSKLAMQFVMEILMVALVSLIIGAGFGTLLSQPVTNQILKSEISSYQEQSQSIQNNFGGSNFERPSQKQNIPGRGNENTKNTDYVDHLSVKMDWITLLELFLVSLFLTISTSLISILFMNRYEPNKILQNR